MSDFIVPSSMDDRERIKKAVLEMSDSMAREDAEKELQKEIKDALKENLGVPPSLTQKISKDYHLAKFDERVAAEEEYCEAYEVIMK